MTVLRVVAIALALFAAYVVGRAIGIATGIGPFPMQVAAIALVIAFLVRRHRAARRSAGHEGTGPRGRRRTPRS